MIRGVSIWIGGYGDVEVVVVRRRVEVLKVGEFGGQRGRVFFFGGGGGVLKLGLLRGALCVSSGDKWVPMED